MQDIIKFSKTYQKNHIEAVERKKKKLAEDWLKTDFFDFNDEEDSKPNNLNLDGKKANQDFYYNDYPIKKRKLENENAHIQIHSYKENSLQNKLASNQINQIPHKRIKKVKKQYSPSCSHSNEKKKKSCHNSENHNEKKHHHNRMPFKELPKQSKKENNREKNDYAVRKQVKQDESKNSSEKIIKYPNFLDDGREM